MSEVGQCQRCDGPITYEKDVIISKGNVGFMWTAPTGDVVIAYCQSCFIDMARWVASASKEQGE
jgi:hypothetical protein